MKITITKWLAVSLGAAIALVAADAVNSQPYPNKPGRLLVGLAPSGGVDVTARIVAAKLSEIWCQQLVVGNRAGAI